MQVAHPIQQLPSYSPAATRSLERASSAMTRKVHTVPSSILDRSTACTRSIFLSYPDLQNTSHRNRFPIGCQSPASAGRWYLVTVPILGSFFRSIPRANMSYARKRQPKRSCGLCPWHRNKIFVSKDRPKRICNNKRQHSRDSELQVDHKFTS